MDNQDGRLDEYLETLRAALRGLPETEVADIVEEIRSHVRDSTRGPGAAAAGAAAGDAFAAVLARLGSPAELAEQYLTASMMKRAGRSRSPWLLVASLLRWATVSVSGFFAFSAVVAGYTVAVSLVIAAILKPFRPDRVGLWRLDGDEISLRLGFGAPVPGEEILGWWMLPVGLLLGAAGLFLTTRFARFCVRRFHRAPLARIG